MKVYVYKQYNDEYAYGEENIQVFSNKKDAVAELKADVSEHYGMPFEEIPSDEDIFDKERDTFEEVYVSIVEGDGCLFWIIEEHEVKVRATCSNCGATVSAESFTDELGAHIICPTCGASSDV